jgi:hypothetical protein
MGKPMRILLVIVVLVFSCSEYDRGHVLDAKSDQFIQIQILNVLADTLMQDSITLNFASSNATKYWLNGNQWQNFTTDSIVFDHLDEGSNQLFFKFELDGQTIFDTLSLQVNAIPSEALLLSPQKIIPLDSFTFDIQLHESLNTIAASLELSLVGTIKSLSCSSKNDWILLQDTLTNGYELNFAKMAKKGTTAKANEILAQCSLESNALEKITIANPIFIKSDGTKINPLARGAE